MRITNKFIFSASSNHLQKNRKNSKQPYRKQEFSSKKTLSLICLKNNVDDCIDVADHDLSITVNVRIRHIMSS